MMAPLATKSKRVFGSSRNSPNRTLAVFQPRLQAIASKTRGVINSPAIIQSAGSIFFNLRPFVCGSMVWETSSLTV